MLFSGTGLLKKVACERQTFLLAHRRWGTRNVPQRRCTECKLGRRGKSKNSASFPWHLYTPSPAALPYLKPRWSLGHLHLPLAIFGAEQTDCSLWARDWAACCSKLSILRKKKGLKPSGNSLNTLPHMFKNSFIICNIFLAGFLKTLPSEVLVAQQFLQSSKYKN